MQLVYFALPGRGEVTRILAKLQGLPLRDTRLDGATWRAEWRAQSPTGQAPLLQLEDGSYLTQSFAIERFLAGPYYPADKLQAARVDELCGCFEEVRRGWPSVCAHAREGQH